MRVLIILSHLGLAAAGACPYAKLKAAGLLNDAEQSKYEEIKRDGGHLEKRAITLPGLSLNLGGGLLNGVLQSFSGRLSLLVPPTPQPQGLKAIPGTDTNHKYIAPGPTDRRGVCPALNTLANHGYLSLDGITTWAEAGNAIQTGFGFGYDLATILSALGLLSGGDLITGKYSIGGADSRVPNTLGPSLGLDKHGTCEVDNSITRIDTYFGNQANFHLDRWQALLQTAAAYGNLFSKATFTDEKERSYYDSRATNPAFNAGPKWFIIAHGERLFVYRNFANGTTPDTPDFANVAPFFLNETFPKNWFRTPVPLSLTEFIVHINTLYLGSPVPLGGNEGLGNFIASDIDPSAMTPSQIACFALENILDTGPGFIAPAIVNNYNLVQSFINGAIAPFFTNYNCDLTNYTVPSASAGQDTTGSPSNDGPVIINGVYQ